MKSMKSLQLENAKLAKANLQLKNAKELHDQQLQNSLGTLVQGAISQTNLTSFAPALQNNIYAPVTINWTLLMYMYKTHGIIQTAIDMPVLDALRGGLELHSDELSQDDLKDLEDHMENLGVLDIIGEAMTWTRLFGGGGLVINTEQDPATPLNLDELKGKKVELYAANRWELGAPMRFSPHYNFYGNTVDASRVLTMAGKAAPYVLRRQLAGWGMSEVERMLEPFNVFLRAINVIYELLDEAKVDVYRLKDFNAQLASAIGTQKIQNRIQLANQLKNFSSALVMDMTDEYDQKQITFAGLAEMLKESRIGIASALRMPMTKLFGLSASGFNSGEDDIENYNAMVESEVRQPMRKVIRKVLRIMSIVLWGEEFDIGFSYRPLRIMSAKDEEVIKDSKHKRIMELYDRSLIDSKEAGEMEQKDKLVSIDIEAAKGTLDPHPAPVAPVMGMGGVPKEKGEEGK